MAAPIRLGFIGLSVSGGWATNLVAPLLPPAALASKYTITALCTRSAESAKATADKYAPLVGHPIKTYHGPSGYDDIANDPEVDMVVVAVKVTDHKKAVTPAIKAGKAVFVEWPLGRGLDETKELAALVKQHGVKGFVGAQAMQSPALRKIAEVIKSGGIGRVVGTSISGIVPKEIGYWGPWITERSTYVTGADSGASMLDIAGGHLLAGLTHLLGDVTSVSATFATLYPSAELVDAAYKPTGTTLARTSEDQLALSGTLASGALLSVHIRSGVSAATPGRTGLVWIIDGEAGTIRVENNALLFHVTHPKSVLINGEKWEPEQELVDVTGNLQSAWEEFAKGPEGAYFTFEDAVKLHTVVDAVRRSAREGVRVNIA